MAAAALVAVETTERGTAGGGRGAVAGRCVFDPSREKRRRVIRVLHIPPMVRPESSLWARQLQPATGKCLLDRRINRINCRIWIVENTLVETVVFCVAKNKCRYRSFSSF